MRNLLTGRLGRLLKLRVWIAERLRPTEWQVTLLWAAVAGLLGAAGSLVFRWGTEDIHRLLTGSEAGVVESFRLIPWELRLAIPAVGGLLTGAVLYFGQHLSRSESSTDYMEAIVIGTGRMPVRSGLVKSAAALFVIGSGGSIGREGPMVQLSATLASLVGRWRQFSPPRLRLLVACGAAAGIASAYSAPIAGAFFVAEIILGSIAMENIGPLVVSSVAAALLMRAFTGGRVLYDVPHFKLGSAWEMGPYLVLGLIVGGLAPWFLRSLRHAEAAFLATRWPLALRLMAGGLVVGALAIRVPEVCGNGYSVVLDILNGRMIWTTVGMVLACKWLATAASFGSGAPGGVFTPSLFMGASAGYLFGCAMHVLWPLGASDPGAFALVGMGAFLSAATHAPVMAVIMLFEMTSSYDIILPLMACSVVAYYVSKGLETRSLYSDALRKKAAEQPKADFSVLRVEQLMKKDPARIAANVHFAEVAKLFLSLRVNNLYVVDGADRLLGAVSLHDIKPFLPEPDLAGLMMASDIMQADFPRLAPDQLLSEALGRFLGTDAHRLPVVAADGRLVGSLAKNDLLLALDERLRRGAQAA